MVTERPNATPLGSIHFRVVAIERFALPDSAKQHHMVLRVEYLDPEDPLRGALFELAPDALPAIPGCHRRGARVRHHLLGRLGLLHHAGRPPATRRDGRPAAVAGGRRPADHRARRRGVTTRYEARVKDSTRPLQLISAPRPAEHRNAGAKRSRSRLALAPVHEGTSPPMIAYPPPSCRRTAPRRPSERLRGVVVPAEASARGEVRF